MRVVFDWMARRTAASYGLVAEAVTLLHEQELGLEGNTQRLLLLNTVSASRHLKLLLVSLRPDLRSDDDGATLAALADFAARHRPRLEAGKRSRAGYIGDVLGRALRETAGVRRLLVCVGERRNAIAVALEQVAEHLDETRALLSAAGRRAADVQR